MKPRRSALPISRPTRSTRIPTSARGRRSWSSVAPAERSMTAARRGFPIITAIYDAGKWIDEDPMRATDLMEKWTDVEKEVLYLYFSKGGHLTQDPTIKKAWVDTLKFDHGVLAQEKLASGLDFDSWINESYIKRAYV